MGEPLAVPDRYDIFISYAHEDSRRAVELKGALQAHNYSVWIDKDVLAGQNWREEIKKALDASACAIVLWSRSSTTSDHVLDEAELARSRKHLVPFRLDDVELPQGFGQHQTGDLRTWDGSAKHPVFQDVLRAVARLVSPGAVTRAENPSTGAASRGATPNDEAPSDSAPASSWRTLVSGETPAPSHFDELYVISDLNLGSRQGTTAEGDVLARLVDYLVAVRPERHVGLVINGDLFDFAEDGDLGFDGRSIIRLVDRIWSDHRFAAFWSNLVRLVHTQRRHLVIVVGEGDVELALPEVSEEITHRLARGDEAARGRLTWVARPAGFRCRVGGSGVLCKHGHDVDSWNSVDPRMLDRIIARSLQGTGPAAESHELNAGRVLRRTFLGPLARSYPFVEVLKPELAVIPLLHALGAPLAAPQIFQLLRAAWRAARGDHRDDHSPIAGPGFFKESEPERPLAPIDYLLASLGTRESKRRFLHDLTTRDTTFSLHATDQTALRTSRVGGDVRFVVTGHTHLERALELSCGGRFYYNTGTWSRILRLSPALVASRAAFEWTLEALGSPDASSFDVRRIPLGDGAEISLVLERFTVLRLVSQPEGDVGELCHAFAAGTGCVRLEPLARARFVASHWSAQSE